MAGVVGLGDVQLDHEYVGVAPHRCDGAGGKQSMADGTMNHRVTRHPSDKGVGDDGGMSDVPCWVVACMRDR